MEKKEIQSLIADCIMQMRMDGYDEKYIETHQRRWQKGIVSYMAKTGVTQFSPKIGESFLCDVFTRIGSSNTTCPPSKHPSAGGIYADRNSAPKNSEASRVSS